MSVSNSLPGIHRLYPLIQPLLALTLYFWILYKWEDAELEQRYGLMLILYSIVILILSRGALRFLFFLLPSMALASAYTIWRVYRWTKLPEYYFLCFIFIAIILQPHFLFPEVATLSLVIVAVYSIALLFWLRKNPTT